MKKYNKKRGQGLVEYALIISLIALAAIFSMSGLGRKISVDLYGLVNGGIAGAEERITGKTGESGTPEERTGDSTTDGATTPSDG